MIDLHNNRIRWDLLTDEERAAFDEWKAKGGIVQFWAPSKWHRVYGNETENVNYVYRAFGELSVIPMTALWQHIPVGFDWIAADKNGSIYCYDMEPKHNNIYWGPGELNCRFCRVDNFPGIVTRGTVAWNESLIYRS